MALDQELKAQLKQYFALLEGPVVFGLSTDDSEDSQKVADFVHEVAQMSDQLSVVEKELPLKPSFAVDTPDEETGIVFAGLPLGHEFSSLVLAILQVSGRAPKISDELKAQIQGIQQELHFVTYVSLTCQNCPDVVQNLNIMARLNPNIHHTMVEGGMFRSEVEARNILAVPTIYLNEEEFASGRISIEKILENLGEEVAKADLSEKGTFDVLVVGGGPAGAAAAVYAARKGIEVGLVADEFGGQVLDTLGIENFIGTEYIEGPQLMANMRRHVESYKVDIIEHQRVANVEREDSALTLTMEDGQSLTAITAVLATGARWRAINVPGEQEFKNKGISYCTHCDGPLYKDKVVAIIGGGNSGIEAALDMAGLAKEVIVLEFLDTLKADQVLQDRLNELDNVRVVLNADTQAILGDGQVEQLVYKDRESGEEHTLDIGGLFILVGLVPNNEWLPETIERNGRGEIIVDERGATSLEGVYAAGDCTDQVFKQIIISSGSGATAALGAYDYLLRQG